MKDEELAAGVVDEKRGDHGGDIRIRCVESEAFDKPGADEGSKKKRNQRDGIEEHELVMPFMFSGFEDEQDVEDVRREVGEHEADDFIDPVVPQADGFADDADVQIQKPEQFGERVAFSQRRKNQPGEEEKDCHIDRSGRAAAHAVFDELDEAVVFFREKRLNLFFHNLSLPVSGRRIK